MDKLAAYEEQIPFLVADKTQIDLYRTPHTKVFVIEQGLVTEDGFIDFADVLYGPYGGPGYLNIFVSIRVANDRVLGFQLLVQDKDDGAFLKPDAEGAERYNVGYVVLNNRTEYISGQLQPNAPE